MELTQGKLFVVATPLGNMKDITLRAIETLQAVDFVLAEDSREANKLLTALKIKKEVVVYHQHTSDTTRLHIFERLKRGEDAALITDAGTPGISDPGNELIHFLTTFDAKQEVTPIPGASAVTALLSVCGFPSQQFTFLGFLPKKKQSKLFKNLQDLEFPFVFFESPHRIIKSLEMLKEYFSENTHVCLGRELTKIHETIIRGNLDYVLLELKKNLPVKGEIVVVVNPEPHSNIPS